MPMVTAAPRLRDAIDEIMPGVIADRRHLHEHPELAFQEVETARFVAERLQHLGVEEIQTGIAQTGVTGLIHGTAPGTGKTVLLRADMDALPLNEENQVEYRSTVANVMHACGHDGHTAMLLGVSRILLERRDQFAGTVKVLFQPAEEVPPGGAQAMIAAGVLDNPKVDAAFGMHLAQEQPLGQIAFRAGPTMAAADRFSLTIRGKGGHGARPQSTVDPIAVGAQIVVALQTIVARETDPLKAAVVTVGAFRAGDAFNVIPDTAELRGTVRTFDPAVRDGLEARIEALVRGIASAMRAEIDFTYARGYPATINHPEMTALARAATIATLGEDRVIETPQIMGAEDFSYFLEAVPGCFFFVGSRNPDKGLVWGHHHPRFDFDEEALGTGIEAMVATTLHYLNG